MRIASRLFPHLAIAALVLILVVGLIPSIAFTPPSSVPYNAAAYADRAKLGNATGLTDLAAYAGPAACPKQVNLFSKNVGYSIPVLSLPGRAGLHLGLSLFYNSKVWVKSGSTIYFDGDKGWPGPGWRLGFGRIDGVYSGPDGYNHYYLISGDGGVRDLRYNSSTGLYESRDSTFIDFNDATGVLRYNDGTQVTYAAVGGFVQPVQVKDTNGNYITINYTGTGQRISSIVDTVGRTVSFSYNPDTTLASISKPGFGGAARTWTFGYTNITLSYSFATSLTVNGPSNGSQVQMLSSITFPNSAQVAFTYNGYAQLTEAAWKSSSGTLRGKCLTSWQTTPGGGWTDSPTPASVGNFDGANTNYWTLAFNTYSTTVTDPASGWRTTSFLQAGSWDDGLPSQTQAGSPLVTALNYWDNDGTLANPRITNVTTTNDSGQQSKVEFDYTTYGNISEVREYDYGFVLQRRTTTSYETGFHYTSRHILALPQSITLYDAASVAKAQSDFIYDAGALTYVGGAANHDDINYGTGFFYRGLVTSVTRFSFSSSPDVTNTASYDMLGTLRTESANCCVQRQYNFSSTTQFAFPDSIVRGSGTTLTTSATYDSNTGLVASSTNENNKVTSYNYDVMDRITTVTRPDNTQLTSSYDDSSATWSTTSTTPIQTGKSLKRKTEFDGLGRAIRLTTMNISSLVYSKADVLYDSVGRTWKVSNPYTSPSPSYWTETQYDDLSRVTKTIPPDGSSFSNNITYSYSGNAVTVTDQAGKQRKTKTDALGRTIEVDEPDPNNGNSLTLATLYGYDPMDSLTQVNQGVQGRTSIYDGLSRLLSEATSEAGTTFYQYDNQSLLLQRTDARGVVTSYTYDTSLNRLTQISYNTMGTSAAPTSSVGFTYGTNPTQNNNGRLVTMSYGTYGWDTESYTYDQLGRTTQVQKFLSSTYTIYNTNYSYNLASEVASITYPSGRFVTNSYDAIGRPQYASDNMGNNFVSNAQYNQANQVTSFSHGNGVSAFFGYSAQRLQLTSLRYAKGPNLLNLSYGYTQNGGNNGQITSITDNVQPGRSVTYSYDSLYRLTTAATPGSAQYPQWGLQWTYDRYGNPTAQTVTAGSPPSYAVTLNPYTNRILDPGFSYDSAGNMTADGLNLMVYDAENRMVSSTSAGATTNYTYDGNSLRLTKQAGGTTTTYLYSGQKVIAEYASGSPNKEYVYFAGQLIATLLGGSPTYHLRDRLSIRVNTNSAGTVSGEQGHFPYGEQWYASGGTSNFLFTSYQRDSESGNDNAVFRTRSTRFGRFSSSDPVRGAVGNPQSLNRYAYTRNDPVNFVDPRGLNLEDPENPWRQLCYIGHYEVPWVICQLMFGGFGGGGGAVVSGGYEQDPPEVPIGPPPGGPIITSRPFMPPPPCPVSAQSLNDYLQSSPMAGVGDALFNAGRTYNVDPRFIVAIAGAETSFGKNITRGQFNAWNWFYRGPKTNDHPFSSWEEGINRVTKGIGQGPNYFQAGLNNTADIYKKYCLGPDCVNGLKNINTFLTQQGGDPTSLRFPCK